MTRPELLRALRRMKVETGSLVCLGCGHEHSCGTRGCAILRAAAEEVGHLDWACQQAQLILAEAYGAAEDGPVADALFAVAGQVKQVLAADVRPVVRGKWEHLNWGFDYDRCSVCGYEHRWPGPFYFCPNCGADMREEATP